MRPLSNFPHFNLPISFLGNKSPLFLVIIRVEPNPSITLTNAILVLSIPIAIVLNKICLTILTHQENFYFNKDMCLSVIYPQKNVSEFFVFVFSEKQQIYIFRKKINYLYSFRILLQWCYFLGNNSVLIIYSVINDIQPQTNSYHQFKYIALYSIRYIDYIYIIKYVYICTYTYI